MRSKKQFYAFIAAIIITLFAFAALMLSPVLAQETTPEPGAAISFSGTISAVSGTTIVVNGLSVTVDTTTLGFTPQVGQTVTVNGSLLPSGQIVAVSVVIVVVGDDDGGDDDDGGSTTPEATPETTATPQPELTPEVTPEVTPEATPDDDDDSTGVIIVIEGPVQQINVNIITIYNINVEVNVNNPILTVVQIGDIIRVEGVLDDDLISDDGADDDGSGIFVGNGVSITIIAITVIIVDVDVVVNPDDGTVWRDAGDCSNAPPPWAPANGWRRRCEGGGSVGAPGRGNDDDGGRGRGNDRDDDDGGDDDDD